MLTSTPLRAEVEVRSAGDRISLRAVSAPVSEVLDSLAHHTGMSVSYDAAPPRQTLTATLEDRAPAEVVLSVLEGLGLNYALVMDRGGARVDRLLILGALSTTEPTQARSAAPAAQPTPPAQQPNPHAELGAREDEDEDDPEEDVLAKLEQAAAAGAATPPAPTERPAPPQYPSSAFTPRLPLPGPAAAPSAQPTPAAPRDQ